MIKHENIKDIKSKHICMHDGYEYTKRTFLPRDI